MDEIELLVSETFKHFHQNFGTSLATPEVLPVVPAERSEHEFPEGPGVLYHVQKSASVFVVRTLVSKNVKEDYRKVLARPEDYPSLRLLEGGGTELDERLKFFMVEEASQAEIIHDQIHNRRFPVFEEMMCNLSDPGFSWWLTKKEKGFQVSFTMSVASGEDTIKLGPLGDLELAVKNFQILEELAMGAGLGLNIQNETNRVQFTDCEEFLLEELKDVFEFGVITETLRDIFKILSMKVKEASSLQTSWFYLQEIAAVRRFWIQIQFDLNS